LTLGRLSGRARQLWAVLLIVCLAGLTFTLAHRDLRSYRLRDDDRELSKIIPAGACVVTSMSASTITSDRYDGGASCPALLDSFGVALTYADGRSPASATLTQPRLRALWLRAYERADYVFLVQRDTPTVPSDATLRRYLATHFARLTVAGLDGTLYRRNHS
jgi:hypothetical protein